MDVATALAGVRTGKLYQGYFAANPYNYLEVRVLHESSDSFLGFEV